MDASTASWLIPLIIGGAGAASQYAGQASQRRSAKEALAAQQAENEKGRLFSEEQLRQRTALDESMADPFRHAMQQQNALGRLDMIQRFNPTQIQVPGALEGYAPKMSGGYSASPEMRGWAGTAQREIAAGRGQAPTMTNPANYGKTGVMDLVSMAAGGPSTPGAAGTPVSSEAENPFTMDEYFAGTPDRNEGAGGIGAGMKTGFKYGSMVPGAGMVVGPVIGGIAGAITKNAKTARTDKSVENARLILAQAFRQELGREATPQEIDQALQGQGLKPGGKWVGRGGLEAIIRALRAQRSSAQAA